MPPSDSHKNKPGLPADAGDTVVVALEGPGPGTRHPDFLRNVEGTVTRVVDPGLPTHALEVSFPITEDNYVHWERLMPDPPPEIGTHLDLDNIAPSWVMSVSKAPPQVDPVVLMAIDLLKEKIEITNRVLGNRGSVTVNVDTLNMDLERIIAQIEARIKDPTFVPPQLKGRREYDS